jgi:hypothetical protein
VWLTVAVLAVQLGADYYRTPQVDRPFSADHEIFKPSGLVGHGFGIAGTVMMRDCGVEIDTEFGGRNGTGPNRTR